MLQMQSVGRLSLATGANSLLVQVQAAFTISRNWHNIRVERGSQIRLEVRDGQ